MIRFFVFDENVTAHFNPELTAQFKSDKSAQYHRIIQINNDISQLQQKRTKNENERDQMYFSSTGNYSEEIDFQNNMKNRAREIQRGIDIKTQQKDMLANYFYDVKVSKAIQCNAVVEKALKEVENDGRTKKELNVLRENWNRLIINANRAADEAKKRAQE